MIYLNQDLVPELYPRLIQEFSRTAHKKALKRYHSYMSGKKVRNSYPQTIVHSLTSYLVGAEKQMFTAVTEADKPMQNFLERFFQHQGIYKILVDIFSMVGGLGQGFLLIQPHVKRGYFDYHFSLVSPLNVLQIIDIRNQKKSYLLKTQCQLLNYKTLLHYVLYTEEMVVVLDREGKVLESKKNLLETPPLIFFDNPERKPDYYQAIDAIEKLDIVQSEDMKILRKLFDSILVTSMRLDEEKVNQLQHLRVIDDLGPEARFEIHTHDPEHEYRKHLKEHYINEIFVHTGLFDFSQIQLGTDISGTALQYKIYPMKLFADQKEATLKIGLRKMLELLGKCVEVYPHYLLERSQQWDLSHLHIVFHRNLPKGDNFSKLFSMRNEISSTTLLEEIGLSYEKETERKAWEQEREVSC